MSSIGAQFRSLRDVVTDSLRERIVECELEPGLRLVERDLADELGVSRITLREALQQLAAEGLVTIAPRRGAWVAPLSVADVHHLFDVRLPLELLAARSAAERRTDEDLARMRAALDGARQADERDDDPALARHNAELHLAIVTAAANPVLAALVGTLTGQLRRLFQLVRQHDHATLAEEHQELYAAIEARDADRAERLMRAHVLATLQPTIDVLERRG